jgi:SAM-dependent methyltransferase
MDVDRCWLCGSGAIRPLPQIPSGRSVTTDGLLLDAPWRKYQCTACDLVLSDPTAALQRAAFSYEQSYDFYGRPEMRAFERARYQNYATWVTTFLERRRPQTVLEVGCGDGWVLELLRDAHPSITLAGLEPSAAACRRGNAAGLDIQQGIVSDQLQSEKKYDFLYCVNVVEHVADPAAFVRGIRELLTESGAALIICPCGNVVDPELLFADHIHSFTRDNLAALLEREGLPTSSWQPGANELSPFQAIYAGKLPEPRFDDHPPHACDRQGNELQSARDEYCGRWGELDDALLHRLEKAGARSVACFGAGETSDLLRAYVPRTWQRIEAYVIDRPVNPEAAAAMKPRGGLPVVFTDTATCDAIVLGVKPRYHATLAPRLQASYKIVVRWDDLFPEPF